MIRKLLALSALLGGCNAVLVDLFPRDVRDETPAPDDDDETPTPPPPEPPTVQIIDLEPPTVPVVGSVGVRIEVSDPDSSSYTLSLEYGTQGVGSSWAAATVENATTAPNLWEETVPDGPGFTVQPLLQWDSATDIPSTSQTAALRACVVDGEGNTGACDIWPDGGDLAVDNYTLNGGGAFCQPGDVEPVNWVGPRAFVPLSDGNCLNYVANEPPLPDDFAAQFLMVLVNPNDDDVTFRVSATDSPNFGGAQVRAGLPISAGAVDLGRQLGAEASSVFGNAPLPFDAPMLTCAPNLTPADVNFDARNFYLREAIGEDDRITRAANLRALGDTVAIYVDEETPMDIDLDCQDPTNPIQLNPLPSFGFTNCDLEAIVSVWDQNIFPTLVSQFGTPSDVDQDCRVSVFLSHRLNRLTAMSQTDADDSFLVKSFSEPQIDLWERHLQENPYSNEREMIYVFAPDPVGFWSDQDVQLDDYLSFELAGQLSASLQNLISYAHHRDVAKELHDPTDQTDVDGPPAEDDWLNDGMGMLAADLTGFGAIAYPDAWIYMDSPHLLSLLTENTLADFQDRGGQYLFARYLYDLYGPGFIPQVIDAQTVGVETIEEVAAMPFEAFAGQWAMAMTVSGRLNDAGGLLVPDAVVPNYKASTTVVVADPQNPLPGELYGANGFQQGFNVRGLNRSFRDGSSPSGAVELTKARVLTENLDPLLLHPQADFFGKVSKDYGVVVVKVSGLEREANYLIVESERGDELYGSVVRIEDYAPTSPVLTLEDVDGAKITTLRELGVLDPNGAERNVIGRLDPAEQLTILASEPPPEGDDDDDTVAPAAGDDDDSAAETIEQEIEDTDRYGFTLPATSMVGIWVDRRFSDLGAQVELDDVFTAVMRASDVPDVFDYPSWEFGPGVGVCADPAVYDPAESVFFYPIMVPDWVAAQGNLSSNPELDEGFEVKVGAGPDPLLSCEFDHDQDGLADAEEAMPEDLTGQILQRQAENLASDPLFYQGSFDLLVPPLDVSSPFWGPAFIDIDSNEFPEDDEPTSVEKYNIGGRAVETGEEAVWFGTLPPGDYIIVVGGVDGATGPYDLSVRIIVP